MPSDVDCDLPLSRLLDLGSENRVLSPGLGALFVCIAGHSVAVGVAGASSSPLSWYCFLETSSILYLILYFQLLEFRFSF